MANELFCMGCMQPISEFSDNCYHCGYPAAGQNPAGYLPVRTQLSGRYVVGRALEKRNDAIIYIGYDKTARNTVLLREFFPGGLCERLSKQVVPAAAKETAFQKCLDDFRRQARTIARMRELPAMIPVYDIFEENGTIYTVSDQVDGVPLRRHVQALGGHMKWDDVRPLFIPLINSLISIHAAGLFHQGISPDSIVIDSENRLRLDGWQLPDVRNEGGVLKTKRPAGYAAPEQYRSNGVESSQTADVYAIAATMLYVMTGEEPPSAIDRINKTAALLVPAEVAEKWPSHIAPTLCDALALDVDRRIQTAEILRDRLTIAPVVEALKEEVHEDIHPASAVPAKPVVIYRTSTGMKTFLAILICVCVLLVAGIVSLFVFGKPFSSSETVPTDEDEVTVQTDGDTQTVPTFADPQTTADICGMTTEAIVANNIFHGDMSVNIIGAKYSDLPFGTVMEQSPAAGETAERGTIIEAYISAGPRESALADLTGTPKTVAEEYLTLRGCIVNVVYVDVSEHEYDCVDHTQPAMGTPVAVGTEVTLYVSNVEQPDFQIGG